MSNRSQKRNALDNAIAFHMHNAIASDLNELLNGPTIILPDETGSRAFSSSSSIVTPPIGANNVPLVERRVCQVRDHARFLIKFENFLGPIQTLCSILQTACTIGFHIGRRVCDSAVLCGQVS